jgi:hypothetical protein
MDNPEKRAQPGTQERIEGPTPGGGAYAMAFFMDIAGQPTTKEKAYMVEIVEFDKKGRTINHTLGYLK